MENYYISLTPKRRQQIFSSIDKELEELNTCNDNCFVIARRLGLQSLKNVIKALPDGYPLPVKKESNYESSTD